MKTLTTAAAMALCLSAPLAFAKGHDQSGTEYPGVHVGVETVGPAHTLGAALGNGKKPAAENGKSAEAGKPTED